jgi:hypothetical protein
MSGQMLGSGDDLGGTGRQHPGDRLLGDVEFRGDRSLCGVRMVESVSDVAAGVTAQLGQCADEQPQSRLCEPTMVGWSGSALTTRWAGADLAASTAWRAE